MSRVSLLIVAAGGLAGCFFKPDPPRQTGDGGSAGDDGGSANDDAAAACMHPVSTTFDDLPTDACSPWGARIAGIGGGSVTRAEGGLKIEGQLDVQFNDGCVTQKFSIVNGASVRLLSTPLGQGDYTTFFITPDGSAETGFKIVYDQGLALWFVTSANQIGTYGPYNPATMGWLKLTVRNLGGEPDAVEAFYSRDGADWTLFASETYPLGISRLVSVKLASSGPVNSGYTLFDDLNIKTCPPAN